MKDFHLLFIGNPVTRDIFSYLQKAPGLRISSFQSRTDKAILLSRAPTRTICTELNDHRETLALARAVHECDPFDAVLALYELFTPLAAMVRDELGLCGVSRHSVRAARDKLVTRHILTKAGLCRVPYARIESADALDRFVREVDGPVVLKPINGVASRCIFFLDEPGDAARTWAKAQADLDDPDWLKVSREGQLVGYMAERFIDGAEYSVEAITHDRKTHVIAVVEKGLKGAIESGHSVPAESLAPERVALMGDYVKRVLAAIEVDSGISHTEVKWSSYGPELVEINLRLAGDSIPKVVELAYGNDIILDYLRLAIHGQTPERTRNGAAGIRFFLQDHCRIDAIESVDAAAAIPGVRSIVVDAAQGKVIDEIRSSRDRAGFVIAQAATRDEVQRTLDQAFATVKFITSRNEQSV